MIWEEPLVVEQRTWLLEEFNRNSIGRQAEEWKNGAIKQQTYWRGCLSKRSEGQEQGARTRTRKRWWMSFAECGGNRLQRFIRFLFKKKGTFSEWQTSECAVFWVESCVSGTNWDVDVQVNVCLSEAEAARCPVPTARASPRWHIYFSSLPRRKIIQRLLSVVTPHDWIIRRFWSCGCPVAPLLL